MGRKLDVDQLVGASDIAARLGATRHQMVHTWRKRYDDFPQPVVVIDRTYVWYWPEVERWARKTGRLPGRVSER